MRITWDSIGERFYETGTSHGVLFPQAADGSYPKGIPWNGLTAVTESPGGAEATATSTNTCLKLVALVHWCVLRVLWLSRKMPKSS